MTTQDLHNGARATLQTAQGPVTYYRLLTLEDAGLVRLDRTPFSIRILLENMLRKVDGSQTFMHGFPGNTGKGHWNEQGHRFVSRQLADAICTMIGPPPGVR